MKTSPPVRIALALSAAALFATASLSAQAVISTAQGNGADTFLSNDSQHGPTVVHGAAGSLSLRAFTDVRARVIMLRFDVSNYIAESLIEGTITMNFTWATRARTWNVYGLMDESLGDWIENETNYNNAPGILPASLGNYAIDESVWAPIGTFAVTADTGLQTTNVTDLNLDDLLTGNESGLVTLLFAFPSGGDSNPDWAITSKEGDPALAPTLNVPNAIPEPSTYALLAGLTALIGAIYFRRRKS
ncbi:MAG: PEP-CTERM sorting domain-containing protein [Puniceicoccaceae bacterium]|nr:MAG: PEP-CTERM sorting domain-containing protein [Puniceicoccaceae bacterium]